MKKLWLAFGEAMAQGLGYSLVFYLVWSLVRLDISTIIGIGIRAGSGVCL